MSRPATRDAATGRLSLTRHAASSGIGIPLGHRSGWSAPHGGDVVPRSGDNIRPSGRIVAGDDHRFIPEDVWFSRTRGRNALGHYTQLPAASVAGLFHSDASSLLPGLMRPVAGSARNPPRVGLGHQSPDDALRHGVQLLKLTHPHLQLVSRASASPGPSRRDLTTTFVTASFAHEGDRGRIPYDGNFTAKDGNVAR